MPKYKLNYREGTVFAVPLAQKKFAIGVAARLSKRAGGVLGYFFAPKISSLPKQVHELKPSDAVWIAKFGDLALVRNEWPIVGKLADWDRDKWPVPLLGRCVMDMEPYMAFIDEFDPENVGRTVATSQVSVHMLQGLFVGGSFGAGAVARTLSDLLADENTPGPYAKILTFDAEGRLDWGG